MNTQAQAPDGPSLFGGYGGDDDGNRRNWVVATFGSTAIYVAIALLAVALGSATKQVMQEKPVDVTFVEKVVKEPPPAPAPAPKAMPEVKPQAPAAAAPVVRPEQKIRKLDKPPPVKEMVAPREMPQEAPREADPSEDKGVAVYGEGGQGDPAGLEGGVAQGGVVGGTVGGAIALPEDAIAPRPLESNPVPPMVILKVVVLADGSVGDVTVMRGEEPFVSAAVATVKKWKYEPARAQGQAITVYRVIQIPFKLTV